MTSLSEQQQKDLEKKVPKANFIVIDFLRSGKCRIEL